MDKVESGADLIGLIYESSVDAERGLDLIDAILALEQQQLPGDDVVSHLHRADDILKRLDPLELGDHITKSFLDELPLAVLIVNEYAEVLSMNAKAQRELQHGDTLSLENSILMTADREQNAQMQATIRKLALHGSEQGEATLSLTCAESAMPLKLFIRCDSALAALMGFSAADAVLSMSFLSGCASQGFSQQALIDQFGLTKAEARTAVSFALLPDINLLAERTYRTTHTVRAHLKSVFHKTGTHNQAELVRLILSSDGADQKGHDRELVNEINPGTRQHQLLHMPDGSYLGYAEYGPSDGIPLFYFHSFTSSRFECAFELDVLDQLGVRLIAPERSGYGLSSLCQRDGFHDWPERISYLANRLGIDQFHIAAFAGSSGYAMACAHQIPTRIKGVALISPMGEIHSAADVEGMMPFNRRVFELALRCPPKLTHFFGRTLARLFTRNPEHYFQRVYPKIAEADQRLLDDASIRDHIKSTFIEARNKHHEALSLELARYATPWGLPLERIEVPIELWHGKDNRHIPLTMAQKLASRLNHCKTHYLPDEGYYLIYSHWSQILESLIAPANRD